MRPRPEITQVRGGDSPLGQCNPMVTKIPIGPISYQSFRIDQPDEQQNSLLRHLNRPDLATSPKNSTFLTNARTESPTFTRSAPFFT
jgi:hypothetical protein